MSTSPDVGFIPDLTLGWRLRMAREATGMGLREFAAHIGVAPDTCTSAEKDKRKVRPITINAYALASGVDRQWLETGVARADGPDGGPAGQESSHKVVTAVRRVAGHKVPISTRTNPVAA